MDERVTKPTKSISEMRARFCQMWRRDKSDEEFLTLMRELCADDAHLPKNHRRNHIRRLLMASIGDDWYDIKSDTEYRLVE
jgi:hypothetical protein